MAPPSCTHKNGRVKRCGCDHDGVPVAVKMTRKRGQHGLSKNVPESKRPRRSCVDDVGGNLFASRLKLKPIPAQEGKYSLPVRLPEPTPICTSLEKPGDVLRLLSDSPEAIKSWSGHAATAETREDPSSWIGELDPSKRLVIKTAARAAKEIGVALCGGKEEAEGALWERITATGGGVRDPEGDAQVTLFETSARCYELAKKGSTEKRVLQACLSCAPRDTIFQLREIVPVLTLAPGAFSRARQELEELTSGLSLYRTPRIVQRLPSSIVDAVLASVFCPDKVSILSWGVKKVRVNGVVVGRPAIMRRRNQAAFFESYQHESLTSHRKDGTVSVSTFHRIASAGTAGDAQERGAVDHVVGFLVLKYMVERTIIDPLVKEKVLVEMEFNAPYQTTASTHTSRLQNDDVRFMISSVVSPPLPSTERPTFARTARLSFNSAHG